MRASWATGQAEAALPGYVCIVSKTHAIEPFELPEQERAAVWDDVMRDPYLGVHVATQHSFHRTQEELGKLAEAIRMSIDPG